MEYLACITDYAKASGRKKAYSGDDYRIELTENSVWNEGCTVNAAIENVSQKQIRNWSVILTLKKGKISNAWNVDSKVNGNNVILSSKEYNMVLAENGETDICSDGNGNFNSDKSTGTITNKDTGTCSYQHTEGKCSADRYIRANCYAGSRDGRNGRRRCTDWWIACMPSNLMRNITVK